MWQHTHTLMRSHTHALSQTHILFNSVASWKHLIGHLRVCETETYSLWFPFCHMPHPLLIPYIQWQLHTVKVLYMGSRLHMVAAN